MKIVKKDNPRVILTPHYFNWEGEKAIVKLCEDIAKDVKRHIDGVSEIHTEWDVEEICSFCGLTWEIEASGEPVCCEKAQEEWWNKEENAPNKEES